MFVFKNKYFFIIESIRDIQLKDITTEQSSLESIFLNLLKESKNELART